MLSWLYVRVLVPLVTSTSNYLLERFAGFFWGGKHLPSKKFPWLNVFFVGVTLPKTNGWVPKIMVWKRYHSSSEHHKRRWLALCPKDLPWQRKAC